MRLRTLRIHGFKSFADRTEVVFHEGMTAIVGPNGCGKSNISDAIRWVLGEQRASAIRGARMDEAIFQGTVHRRPVQRAQVSMGLSNEDGALPVPFEEVEISRTVFRDGGSEYSLNRSACRLKDILDLCRDTGLGSNAYSIIENRMIDAILSDRAEERRGLFEEAAGIGKYKDRRKSATRRLEQAEVDLQRLDDLLSEVETKVRSLARQKGKAERHGELRDRRKGLDISLARRHLVALEARLEEIRVFLSQGSPSPEQLQAGIRTAEIQVEQRRTQRLVLEKERSGLAGRFEAIRSDLSRWERELAVAAERGGQAERRLARIGQDREDARSRGRRAREELAALAGQESGRTEEVEALRKGVQQAREESAQVRERLGVARSELDGIQAREREAALRAAQLQGDAEASAHQALDLDRRAAHLEEELAEAERARKELDDQGDLFGHRAEALLEAVRGAAEAVKRAEEERVRRARGVDSLRKEEMAAQDRASVHRARRTALERLQADQEGVEPVLRALLKAGLPGVHGILADSISAPPDVARSVEAFLGVHARAVVVQDRKVAGEVQLWFRDRWGKGGGLVLLPLDALSDGGGAREGAPADSSENLLLHRMERSGPGAPWVDRLLAGVQLFESGSLFTEVPGGRVSLDGTSVDASGVLRLGNPLGASGVLERKAQLEELRVRAEEAEVAVGQARRSREEAQRAVLEAEEQLESLRKALREAEDQERQARTQESHRAERKGRLDREVESLVLHLETTRVSATRSRERSVAAGQELRGLAEEEQRWIGAREEARVRMLDIQGAWERAQGEETRITVELTRLEGELERLRDRKRDLGRAIEGSDRRLSQLEQEEVQSREEVEATATLRRQGEDALQVLFEQRDVAGEALRIHDERVAALDQALEEGERAARHARTLEREASENRHRLELEVGELTGHRGRIEERLRGEWGRGVAELLEEVPEVEGSEEELRAELLELGQLLERLGPVNMLAMEEYAEEQARLQFLKTQRDDLTEARDGLRSAIREINQTATRLFQDTFLEIRENFRKTFLRLFQGGECDLWLADPEDPLESTVEIQASPRGKRTQRIDLLSGGERALTALALLFGIYLTKPSPFCVLDEVDAPLDESNIGRFIRLLEEFKGETQFVVITHNPRTIEAADWIYGVTMEEPGVSSIVGVRLEQALEQVAPSRLAP